MKTRPAPTKETFDFHARRAEECDAKAKEAEASGNRENAQHYRKHADWERWAACEFDQIRASRAFCGSHKRVSIGLGEGACDALEAFSLEGRELPKFLSRLLEEAIFALADAKAEAWRQAPHQGSAFYRLNAERVKASKIECRWYEHYCQWAPEQGRIEFELARATFQDNPLI